jgi:hypothetical protein
VEDGDQEVLVHTRGWLGPLAAGSLDTLGGSAIAAVRNSVRVARRVFKFMVGRRGSRRLLDCSEGWFGMEM